MIDRPDSVHVNMLHPSPNIEPRRGGRSPDLLLLHYTGMTCVEKAIGWLAQPESKVSCHYVVGEDGAITQMVAENMRAWHAGQSIWAGETDINSCSIGIEIHNAGHSQGYPPFPDPQMEAVKRLSADIVTRHCIARQRVLAHSDVAPRRKVDPGEKFDWRALAMSGVGNWVEAEPVAADDWSLTSGARSEQVADAQHLLRRYGYDIEVTGTIEQQTSFVLRAFQLHWRPALVNSCLDASTMITLRRLADNAADAEATVA